MYVCLYVCLWVHARVRADEWMKGHRKEDALIRMHVPMYVGTYQRTYVYRSTHAPKYVLYVNRYLSKVKWYKVMK